MLTYLNWAHNSCFRVRACQDITTSFLSLIFLSPFSPLSFPRPFISSSLLSLPFLPLSLSLSTSLHPSLHPSLPPSLSSSLPPSLSSSLVAQELSLRATCRVRLLSPGVPSRLPLSPPHMPPLQCMDVPHTPRQDDGEYRIAGNFRGVKFSRIRSKRIFRRVKFSRMASDIATPMHQLQFRGVKFRGSRPICKNHENSTPDCVCTHCTVQCTTRIYYFVNMYMYVSIPVHAALQASISETALSFIIIVLRSADLSPASTTSVIL